MQAAQPKLMPQPLSPSEEQRNWLSAGLQQPGGKLPLHDERGQRIAKDIILSCVQAGWAEPWALNPLQSENLVCRLTVTGRAALQKEKAGVIRVDFSQWRRDSGETVPLRH